MKAHRRTSLYQRCRSLTIPGIVACALSFTSAPQDAQASSKKPQHPHHAQKSCTLNLAQLKVPHGFFKGASYAQILEWISSQTDPTTNTHYRRMLSKALNDLPKQRQMYAQNAQLCRAQLSHLNN